MPPLAEWQGCVNDLFSSKALVEPLRSPLSRVEERSFRNTLFIEVNLFPSVFGHNSPHTSRRAVQLVSLECDDDPPLHHPPKASLPPQT